MLRTHTPHLPSSSRSTLRTQQARCTNIITTSYHSRSPLYAQPKVLITHINFTDSLVLNLSTVVHRFSNFFYSMMRPKKNYRLKKKTVTDARVCVLSLPPQGSLVVSLRTRTNENYSSYCRAAPTIFLTRQESHRSLIISLASVTFLFA